MPTISFSPRHCSVGGKITVFTVALVSLILASLTTLISIRTSTVLEQRAEAAVTSELNSVMTTTQVFHTAMVNEAASFARLFAAEFPGPFTVDAGAMVAVAGKATPALANGGKVLNLDTALVDRYTAQTGVIATIFAANGDEFVRISTSLKKQDGERAIGTQLDHNHPSFAPLRAGQRFVGMATLFGKQYITQYDPVRDAGGKVVGVLFIGLDISKNLAMLKEKIRQVKIGQTGYIYIVDTAPGASYGQLVLHPNSEGKSALDFKASDGRLFIQDMLAQKDGTMRYTWTAPGETAASAREKQLYFRQFKDWQWIIAGGTFTDEITLEARQMRKQLAVSGFIALLVFALLLYWLVRTLVSRPLAAAETAAEQIAAGDLTVHLDTTRLDEIGRLLRAMNRISDNLSQVVGNVRGSAGQIATASGEIASGNLDLSSRTEQQASSLEETAASMEELSSTVRQNVDHAQQASRLARDSSTLAATGGAAVAQVASTMDAIRSSSSKIADIIGVIDGIAFQTNILALNAAVEAARAGEQGRGFAVVATEVRTLAQRSTAAAKDIKDLIQASASTVDLGHAQVSQASATMDTVVASVQQVSTIMAEIAQASDEQRSGIEQVNQAIAQMDQVTQQNAALVEEAAAAADALQEQAHELNQVVGVFKL
ncbi:methyl-accepting chemotaxis protein [Janthinobacterium sp. 64]|uniref:methyl-accepting chemotaxis protein n=1 Tax=Janthinobacterium sp. 64 TaxID=2035208 RepID=UPI000CC34A35|nr:methyl-accepting chemotaxis protein [Janthinobacterium sp. 64]PKB20867.1 methyl-accepting chemotaxis protein-2 (aspartate sensor receptor) [Janthinobacterium sp. 64]